MIAISLFYCCKKELSSKKSIDDWEKFNETLLTENKDFYSHLNMEDKRTQK